MAFRKKVTFLANFKVLMTKYPKGFLLIIQSGSRPVLWEFFVYVFAGRAFSAIFKGDVNGTKKQCLYGNLTWDPYRLWKIPRMTPVWGMQLVEFVGSNAFHVTLASFSFYTINPLRYDCEYFRQNSVGNIFGTDQILVQHYFVNGLPLIENGGKVCDLRYGKSCTFPA